MFEVKIKTWWNHRNSMDQLQVMTDDPNSGIIRNIFLYTS